MTYLGLLCFGLFAGTLLCIGLLFVDDLTSWQKAIAFILGAVVSGGLLKFLDVLGTARHPDALSAYPIGLFIALIWSFNPRAANKIRSTEKRHQFLGWIQLAGTITVTAFLVTYVVVQTPTESPLNKIVYGVAVALAFGVVAFLLYSAVASIRR